MFFISLCSSPSISCSDRATRVLCRPPTRRVLEKSRKAPLSVAPKISENLAFFFHPRTSSTSRRWSPEYSSTIYCGLLTISYPFSLSLSLAAYSSFSTRVPGDVECLEEQIRFSDIGIAAEYLLEFVSRFESDTFDAIDNDDN